MIEPSRNDRCIELPRTIGCTGTSAVNSPDSRIHLDGVDSVNIIRGARKASDEGAIINWAALSNVMRLTCWA